MSGKTVLVTHVTQYTGPGIIPTLVKHGYQVLCHDTSFVDTTARQDYANKHKVVTLSAQTPEEIYAEVKETERIERFVFNNIYPNVPTPIEDLPIDTWQEAFQALTIFPIRLTQLFLPRLKTQNSGTFIFITSARQCQPEPGYALATSLRAGTSTFANTLAKEVAPHNIQVNTIQPNYLYSELYYPKATYIDNPEGRALIEKTVPMGRLGTPEEFGELVEFFVSGRSPFTTGQTINFAGGWPG
ncbi:MAG: SDR family oxidoreductase [Agarilytica sp.]